MSTKKNLKNQKVRFDPIKNLKLYKLQSRFYSNKKIKLTKLILPPLHRRKDQESKARIFQLVQTKLIIL